MGDFKQKQKELTELNADGNQDRGRYGEDESKPVPETANTKNTWTFKVEDVFEDIPDDPNEVLLKIPEAVADKAGFEPGDPLRVLWGDQGTIIIEKIEVDADGKPILDNQE